MTTDQDEVSDKLIQVLVQNDCVYLDEERMTLPDLAPYLAARLADRVTSQERAVVLDADASVRYERVVHVANEIKRAGGIITIMKVEE